MIWLVDFRFVFAARCSQYRNWRIGWGQLFKNHGSYDIQGRSPKDRFIVKDDITKDHIWWGDVNIPFASEDFEQLYNKVTAYLSERDIYVRDSYVCSDPAYRTNIRVINEYPWSNYFAYNMFLRPKDPELKNFEPEWTVINCARF